MTVLVRRIEYLWTSGLIGQLVRFGIVGGISAVIYSLVFLGVADYALPRDWSWAGTVAVPPAFLIAAAAGWVMHSNWSFKGHGSRDPSGRQHARFLIVQAGGMVLNMAFAWLLTQRLGEPNWVALIPAVALTPFVTFIFQRQWVFA
ncbi:MAG: GtrA family protein [Sphingomonas sp.]